MSNWGVPISSFDLGKAWKSVESSIDKAIGITGAPSTPGKPPPSPNTQVPSTPETKTQNTTPNTPSTPSKLDLGTPTLSRTPVKPSTPQQTPQKNNNNTNKIINDDNISLEALLNGPEPIPSTPTKTTPKITPKNETNRPKTPSSPSPLNLSSPSTPTTPKVTSATTTTTNTSTNSETTPAQTLDSNTKQEETQSDEVENNNQEDNDNLSDKEEKIQPAETTSGPTYTDNKTDQEESSTNLDGDTIVTGDEEQRENEDEEKEQDNKNESEGEDANIDKIEAEIEEHKYERQEEPEVEENKEAISQEEDVITQEKEETRRNTEEDTENTEEGPSSLSASSSSPILLSQNENNQDNNTIVTPPTPIMMDAPSSTNPSPFPSPSPSRIPPPDSPISTLSRNGSSSSSLADLDGDDLNKDEGSRILELKTKIIELNGKIAAIAIIEKEKDRQLEEKTKQVAIREKQLESAMERQATQSTELQNLTEEVEKLRSSKSSSSGSTNDIIESLKEEFSRRLGSTERKLQAVTKERDELKKGTSMGEQAKDVVKSKDDEINTLRTEGTNLSLKILNLESAIKKQRAAKKEDDASLASLKERLSQAEILLEKRNDKIKQLESNEKKYIESLTTMKDLSDNVARKLEKKDIELLQAQKQVQDLQNNLERATKDLVGAKRYNQEAGVQHLSEVEEAKKNLVLEFQAQTSKQTTDYQNRINQLEATISELRGTLSSYSEQVGKKEDSLLAEIVRLRGDLDSAEKRNEEIMHSIPNSTRPLLRQIEALQSLLDTKTRTADALEQDLRSRLADEEARRMAAVEKERVSSSSLAEMSHRVNTLETQHEEEYTLLQSLRMEVETLKLDEKKYKRQLAEVSAKSAAAEMQNDRMTNELNMNEERHQRTISAMREIEEALNKSRDKEKEMREELGKLHRFGSTTTLTTAPATPTLTSSGVTLPHSGSTNNLLGLSGSQQISADKLIGERERGAGLPVMVERLHAMLEQRDGEIAVLHSQLSSFQAARKDLHDELASVTSKNEDLAKETAELQALRTETKELHHKFSTAMQLVGEKEEQVMELKLDIQDLKEMYRTQISELIEQNERLRKR